MLLKLDPILKNPPLSRNKFNYNLFLFKMKIENESKPQFLNNCSDITNRAISRPQMNKINKEIHDIGILNIIIDI